MYMYSRSFSIFFQDYSDDFEDYYSDETGDIDEVMLNEMIISRFQKILFFPNKKKSTKCNKYTILEKTNGYRQDAKVAYSVR